MNIMDKFWAKRFGVSEERYKESEKIASTIWKTLFCEGKVINPFIHIKTNKGLFVVDGMFIVAMVNFMLLFYNRIYNLNLPKTELLIVVSIFILLFLIGNFLIYRHDMKQFNERLEEIVKWEKDYEGKRWGDLSPEDRKFLLSDYKLTDIDAWRKGEHKEFTGNGMCFVDLNAECCCINGIIHDGQLYINEDDVIVCL